MKSEEVVDEDAACPSPTEGGVFVEKLLLEEVLELLLCSLEQPKGGEAFSRGGQVFIRGV